MKVYDLLSDATRFTTGEWARRQNGTVCHYSDEDAYCFCFRGALKRCYEGKELQDICKRVKRHLGIDSIEQWADDQSFATVIRLAKELRI